MYKFISVLILSCMAFSSHAEQSKQEIIDYCQKTMSMAGGGNMLIEQCIKMELEAQGRIQEFMRDK